MQRTRARYKYSIRYCRQHKNQIQADSIAGLLTGQNFSCFWKNIYMLYRDFVNNSHSKCRCRKHNIAYHRMSTEFDVLPLSLHFSRKQAYWTWYLCAVNRRYVLTYKQNSTGHIYVFELEHFSGINTDIVQHWLIPEVDIAATKPQVIIPRVA